MSDDQNKTMTEPEQRKVSALPESAPDNLIHLPEDPERVRQRRRKRRRILLLIGLALIVVVVLLFVLFPDVFDMDAIRRYFRYMGKQNKDDFGYVSFDAGSGNAYESLGNGVALGTEGGLYFYDLDGQQTSMVQANVAAPRLLANRRMALLYSMGSSYLSLIDAKGETLLDENLGGKLFDVDLSSDGYICYSHTQEGYKTVTTVLGKNHEPMYLFRSSTQYLNACAIAPGGRTLAVAGLTEEDGVFTTTLSLLRTDQEIVPGTEQSETARLRMSLGNQVVYEMYFLSSDRLCILAQDELLVVDTACNVIGEYSFDTSYLRGYALSENGFAVLLLGEGVTGDSYELCTVDQNAQVTGSVELNCIVRSVDACGAYVTVLTDSELRVYRNRLKLYASTQEIGTAVQALAREDGTALLISNGVAELFIP